MKRGVTKIFVANVVNLMISFILGFVLPKMLSVDDYATVKTFQFYAGYLGFLHLGYADGMYLLYGGKDISDIDKNQLGNNRKTMLVFQVVIGTVLTSVAAIIRNPVLVLVAVSIIPVNMIAYYKYLYQATGEFQKYSDILNLTSLLTSIIILVSLFGLKIQAGWWYAGAYMTINILVYVILEIKVRREILTNIKAVVSRNEFVMSIKQGFALMLGNFSSGLLSGMDRWFVKVLLPNADFAFYSFAVSVEILITTFMNPFVITFYNYICICNDIEKIKSIKKWIYVISLYLITMGFGVKWIVELFINQYLPSMKVLFVLFASQVLYMALKTIYINYYKAMKMQNKYMIQLLQVLAIGFVINVIAWNIEKCKESFAVGTFITVLIWICICSRQFPILRAKLKQFVTVLVSLIVYILCGYFFEAIIGAVIYITVMTILVLLVMPESYREIWEFVIGGRLKKRSQNG